MTIVKKLRKLIEAKGESPIGVMTITDGVDKLVKIEKKANLIREIVLDANVDPDFRVFGSGGSLTSKVSDAQEDIAVNGSEVTGKVYVIDGPETGEHHVILHCNVPDELQDYKVFLTSKSARYNSSNTREINTNDGYWPYVNFYIETMVSVPGDINSDPVINLGETDYTLEFRTDDGKSHSIHPNFENLTIMNGHKPST